MDEIMKKSIRRSSFVIVIILSLKERVTLPGSWLFIIFYKLGNNILYTRRSDATNTKSWGLFLSMAPPQYYNQR